MATSDSQALLLQVSADVSKLQKQFEKAVGIVNSGSDAMERRAKHAGNVIEGAFEKPNVGKALKSVFDSSRLAVIEEGSTKLRVFGSALEPLGALGLGAAAGIAALGISLEEAHKAVEFADNLYKLAKNAHVTTDELQEMQVALRMAGGNAADASAGLQSFSITLGKASVGAPKALKGFQELWGKGFAAEDVKRLGDTGAALDAVVEKIAGLKSNSQKDAVISQLGLDQLKPLIEGGIDKWREFKAEAISSGQVMDASLIKRGHELNEQLEALHGKIDVDLKTAFINLGPILVELTGLLSKMAGLARDVADAIADIGHKSDAGLAAERKRLQLAASAPLAGLAGTRDGELKRIAEIDAELARRKAENKPVAPPTGSASLTDLSHHAALHDETLNFDKSARDAYENGLKALIAAQLALTGDIQERADAEKKAVDTDLTKKLYDLDVEEAKIRAAKNDAHKTEQLALIEKAKTEEQNAAAARKELIDRQTAYAIEDRAIEVYKANSEAQLAELQAQASISGTAKERAALELKILALRQQLERDLAETAIDRRVKNGELSAGQGASLKSDFERTQNAQAAAQARNIVVSSDPILTYLDSLRDLNTELKTEGVTALKGVAAGIADIVANGAKAGDVLRSLVRQLLYDMTNALVQRAEGSILGHLGIKLPDTGATAAASMSTAITAAGGTAATAMGTAIETAGAAAAGQIAAAMAAGGTGGGTSGFLGSIASFFGGGGGTGAGAGDLSELAGLYADGTDSARGGWSMVGERGPEILNIPRGAQVIPNDILRGLSKSGGAKSGDQINHHWNVNVSPTSHMSAADNRRTASQIATALRREMGQSARRGF